MSIPQKIITSLKDYTPTEYKDQNWTSLDGTQVSAFMDANFEYLIQSDNTDEMFVEFSEDDFSIINGNNNSGQKTRTVTENKQAKNNNSIQSKSGISSNMMGAARDAWETTGFEKGRVVGAEEARKELEEEYQNKIKAISEQFDKFCADISSKKQVLFENLEKGALQLSLQVAKRVLDITTEVKPEYIIELLHKAFALKGEKHPLKIRLCKTDFENLKILGLPDELKTEKTGVVYEVDNNLTMGCIIEAEIGEIDMQVENMCGEIVAQLEEIYK